MSAHEYAKANAERFRNELFELLRIPSVSTTPELAGDVRRAADWLVTEMKRIGFPQAVAVASAGHPFVYG